MGCRFTRPEIMKCRHFLGSCFDSRMRTIERLNNPHIMHHILILNGAVNLVNGKNASLNLKQNPKEACRYGSLPVNNNERSFDNAYPPIVKLTSPINSYKINF